MGMWERRRMRAACNEPREMSHIDKKNGTDGIGNCPEPGKIPEARIGRATRDDQFGLVFQRNALDLVHVDALGLPRDTIAHRFEPLARHVDRRPVGQMAAGSQIETHERIARLQQGEENGLIGLTARIGLHIGKFAPEQASHARNRQLFGDIDELAAAIIPPARVALGIFVGHHRALCFQHSARDNVLGGDQLDLVALTTEFVFDGAGDLGIGILEAR